MNETKAEKPVKGRLFFRRDPYASIFAIIAVFFVSQIAAGVLIALYPSLKSWTADEGSAWLQNSVLAQFFYILFAESFAIWLIFWLLRKVKVARAHIGLIRPRLKDIVYALAAYAAYFASYVVIIVVASRFTSLINPDQPQKIGFDNASGPQLILVFAALAILPPLAEEIMFRGFLFTSLRQKFRLRYAIILTSLLFGVAHLQFGSGAPLLWVAAIDTFVLSCVLCYVRGRSGSLWPGIFLHVLKNSVAFIALFHAKF